MVGYTYIPRLVICCLLETCDVSEFSVPGLYGLQMIIALKFVKDYFISIA